MDLALVPELMLRPAVAYAGASSPVQGSGVPHGSGLTQGKSAYGAALLGERRLFARQAVVHQPALLGVDVPLGKYVAVGASAELMLVIGVSGTWHFDVTIGEDKGDLDAHHYLVASFALHRAACRAVHSAMAWPRQPNAFVQCNRAIRPIARSNAASRRRHGAGRSDRARDASK